MLPPKHKYKFNNKLYDLTATVIDLSLGVFPWASIRSTKSAVMVHTLLDHYGYLSEFAFIINGKTIEINVAN